MNLSTIKKHISPYVPGLVVSILLFFSLTPLFLFVIFLGGDSCCGEDTSGSMMTIAWVVSFLTFIAASFLILLSRLIFKKPRGKLNMLINSLLATGINCFFIWSFTLSIIATAFD